MPFKIIHENSPYKLEAQMNKWEKKIIDESEKENKSFAIFSCQMTHAVDQLAIEGDRQKFSCIIQYGVYPIPKRPMVDPLM